MPKRETQARNSKRKFKSQQRLNSGGEGLLSTMQAYGLRQTAQRRALAHAIERIAQPFVAEDLYADLQASPRPLDLVTIYRSLHQLEALGLLQKSDFGQGPARYCLPVQSEGHHHHLLCRSCQKISHLEICGLEKQQKQLAQLGFTQISHKLEFLGLCPKCSA